MSSPGCKSKFMSTILPCIWGCEVCQFSTSLIKYSWQWVPSLSRCCQHILSAHGRQRKSGQWGIPSCTPTPHATAGTWTPHCFLGQLPWNENPCVPLKYPLMKNSSMLRYPPKVTMPKLVQFSRQSPPTQMPSSVLRRSLHSLVCLSVLQV